MGLVTITGTLATDETTARSATSSFVLDVLDHFDTTQPVSTAYEVVAAKADGGTGYFWTVVQNTTAQEAVVRLHLDGTNFVFFPLPGYGILLFPPAVLDSVITTVAPVTKLHARALTGTSILRVIALFVA